VIGNFKHQGTCPRKLSDTESKKLLSIDSENLRGAFILSNKR